MTRAWAITTLAVFASQIACAADGPIDWTACERPVRVHAIDWPNDPRAVVLAAETSIGTRGPAAPSDEVVVLRQDKALPDGKVRLSRSAEGVVIRASEYSTAAGAVVAFCNGRISTRDNADAGNFRAQRLWAHFVARGLNAEEIGGILRAVAANGYRGVIIEIGAWFHSATLPWAHEPGALDAAVWKRLVLLGRSMGLEVVPEVKLLTHQQKLLGLSQRYEAMRINAHTYDPDDPEVRRLVEEFIDEVLLAFGARALHIGHDEAALTTGGYEPRRPKQGRLTPEQFVSSVRFLHQLLSSRTVETWMWADMLLDSSQFPTLPKGEQNGGDGFAATARMLPRQVVLIDWHYYSPSGCSVATRWLRGLGYRVMSAGWWRSDALTCQLRAMSKDPIEVRAEAQIVTTWSHVQRREWAKVSSILRQGTSLYYATTAD